MISTLKARFLQNESYGVKNIDGIETFELLGKSTFWIDDFLPLLNNVFILTFLRQIYNSVMTQ